jgi:hypothetical protein
MKTRIYINQHKIKNNDERISKEPVITIKTYKSNIECYQVNIKGPCRVIYSPDKPLSCGTKIWIETESEVECYDMISLLS